MKAISLWQPWASAIALGLKRNETRKWSTDHRGALAIHAALKDTGLIRAAFSELMKDPEFAEAFDAVGYRTFDDLPRGRVVATVSLDEVVPTGVMLECSQVEPLEYRLGDYSPERFAWRLSNVRRVDPAYIVTGRQGFFSVPDALLTSTLSPLTSALP